MWSFFVVKRANWRPILGSDSLDHEDLVSIHARFYIVAIALAIAGCSSTSDLAVNTGTGTLYGTISNSSGALAGVTVVVTPVGGVALPAVTTNNAGIYRVAGIDVSTSGSGSVAVSGLPTSSKSGVLRSRKMLKKSSQIIIP